MTSLSSAEAPRPPLSIDPAVAPAAICRSLLLGRAAVVLVAAGAGLLVVAETWRIVAVLVITAVSTVAIVSALTRWPGLVRRPSAVLMVDLAVAIAIMYAMDGGMAYFCYLVGSAALAGALWGMRALPVCVGYAALGYVAAGMIVRGNASSPEVAAFIAAFPVMCLLAGIGAATATAALVRFMTLSVSAIAQAQQSAAASERARLARELHDSVAKTLRGISFAALALPSSLRRQPALAEQLAATVSQGAEAAAREARELLEGLRVDAVDQPLRDTVSMVCQQWADRTGIGLSLNVASVDPPVDVRYELMRILGEALTNVERHAGARRVRVTLTGGADAATLSVRDDGDGFVAQEPTAWQADGHFGIVGMYERARRAGGELQFTTAPGSGTTVTVQVRY
ncbi:sensor histidine kinase [Dactylosporangium sp. CA-152071]|uniref:sensor histidine kinase n=1 Tax=Dactylosporangium sp. CA-152071 TaxID=3239933 RepID=UPI003D8CB92E